MEEHNLGELPMSFRVDLSVDVHRAFTEASDRRHEDLDIVTLVRNEIISHLQSLKYIKNLSVERAGSEGDAE